MGDYFPNGRPNFVSFVQPCIGNGSGSAGSIEKSYPMEILIGNSDSATRFYAEIITYNAVHMPTAHISTDGCEALSAQ